jgi:hypothetical protein
MSSSRLKTGATSKSLSRISGRRNSTFSRGAPYLVSAFTPAVDHILIQCLDDNPVHKLDVASSGGKTDAPQYHRIPDADCVLGDSLSFIGVHPRVNLDGKLNKKSFRSIKGGKSVDIIMDAAAMYDLSVGGQFDIAAEGFLPFAGKNKIDGEAAYKSNTISLQVNGTEATAVKERVRQLGKRNTLDSDCTAGRLEASVNALAVCSQLATVAGMKALQGDADQ